MRSMGEEQGRAWSAQIGQMFPQMARIAVRPPWVHIIDFPTRFPSGIARAMMAG